MNDLLHSTIVSLSQEMAEMMGTDRSLKRMDSMMVASNIKKMGRLELLYTCIADLAAVLNKRGGKLPECLQHYTAADDRNRVIYHNRTDDTADKISAVPKDAACLAELCSPEYGDVKEYQILLRVLGGQAIKQEDGTWRLRQKGEGMHSGCLQNPADPDATYHGKAGKQNRGYTGRCTVSFHKCQCEGCPYADNLSFQLYIQFSKFFFGKRVFLFYPFDASII